MKKVSVLLLLVLLLSGCSSLDEKVVTQKKIGIVDACYTVLEYNPCDKEERINHYLQCKQKEEVIDEGQVFVLKECLKRTENSRKWSK